jgi:hypothetical protein
MGTRSLESALLLAGALSLAACSGAPDAATLGCTSKFDCASGETCEEGVCTPMSTSPVIREDAGFHYPRPDAGLLDSGTVPMDSGLPDSGGRPDAMEVVDAGVADSGAFDAGCPTPISVDGFPGYCTISAAIAAASVGSTVLVPAGTYAEQVDIIKDLTLRGVGAPVIQGSGLGAPLRFLSNVTVDGFVIEAAGKTGVEASGTSTLNALTINNAAGIGIAVTGAGSSVTISGCTINTVVGANSILGHGVDIGPGASGTVINTQIFEAGYIGILNFQGTLTVESSFIRNPGRVGCSENTPDPCGYGIIVDGGTGTIRNNTRIEGAGSVGIYVYLGTLSVANSSVSGNGFTDEIWCPGILVDDSDPVNITNSTINNNRHEGVGCYIGSDADCSGNTHNNNGVWTNCNSCDS